MTRDLDVKVDELRMKVKKNKEGIHELDGNIVSLANSLEQDIDMLIKRVKALEDLINSQFAPDTAGHPNDGGWFD